MDGRKHHLLLKKSLKKQSKALSVLFKTEKKSESEVITSEASVSLVLLHYSNGDEAAYGVILEGLRRCGEVEMCVLAAGLPYGYVKYREISAATSAFQVYNDPEHDLAFTPKPHPISLLYTSLSYPQFSFSCEESLDFIPVPGLAVHPEFVSAEEERELVEGIEGNQWVKLTNRRVQHYGYEFVYGENTVDRQGRKGEMPVWVETLREKLRGVTGVRFDQMTVNEYQPGDSIPPHIDSHSPFEEPLVSLSLCAPISMRFTKEEEGYNVYLPRRVLVLMTGEARYVWKHSIQQKRFDIYHGLTHFRSRRISLTFRKVRSGPCVCPFPAYCDRQQQTGIPGLDMTNTEEIQRKYVQDTYDQIADHFSNTRYKPWPQVSDFLHTLSPGSLVLDVGCGNGKYLGCEEKVVMVGTDRSAGLLKVGKEKGHEVFLADSLHIPVGSELFDAVISIAVIHHFSTPSLRLQAVHELSRVLRPSGLALIYVWAKEQTERTFDTQDVLVPWHLNPDTENPTPQTTVLQRFYHVFIQGELESLVSSAGLGIEKSYYDHSNWCVVCRKGEGRLG